MDKEHSVEERRVEENSEADVRNTKGLDVHSINSLDSNVDTGDVSIKLEDEDVLKDDDTVIEDAVPDLTSSEDTIVLDNEDLLHGSDDSDVSEATEDGLFWYIVQCYALYEHKVRDRIVQMQKNEFKGVINRVLLPEEETVEIKNNERKEKIKKCFQGICLCK